jgi:hypothetical protein
MRQIRSLQLQVALASIALAICLGCRNGSPEELPKTFPVVGKVVDSAGHPVTSGAVEFVSTANEKIQAVGKLQPDGTFSLTTMVGSASLPGAVEGKHKVTLLPGGRGGRPHYFKETLHVKTSENQFELALPR